MRRLFALNMLLMVLVPPARASHITGGEMYYTYAGFADGLYTYHVVLKLYQRCNSGRQFPNPAIVSIFDKSNNARVQDLNVSLSYTENIQITDPDPCITNPPTVCFDVAYYSFTVSLPESGHGYVMASQVNYRIAGINNLNPGYNNIGATYSAEIPGTLFASDGPQNHSAKFTGSDLVTVCANNDFNYSFAAEDSDGDELRYYFCEAYASTSGGGGTATPTNPPPFPPVPYFYGNFDESHPLGPAVNINTNTGMISGIAPDAGIYVVTVCVQELRNGNVIATQRKDIQIFIADCSIASASLLPEYYLCKTSTTLTIANQSNSPLIVSSDWEFRDNTGAVIFTASGSNTTYTFPSTGVYTVKLVINRNQSCTDSTTALVKVFPGFHPDFNYSGICIGNPTLFADASTSILGTVNSWNWKFGDATTLTDVSRLQNPVYIYPSTGDKLVTLTVTDTKGCRDTITKTITIIDKPPLTLSFRDTLICVPDRLPLQANGTGSFNWTPPVNIVNANTATPTVNPTITTTYFVTMVQDGCSALDSVIVNVIDHVSLQVMADTTICRGDTIQLRIQSDGLQYYWTPVSYIINSLVKQPWVVTTTPLVNYQVHAVVGSCSVNGNIRVIAVPYPVVNAGSDLTLCYNTKGQLHGITDGSSWQWSPASYLSTTTSLNPFTTPPRTTDFVLTAYDIRGCPKPGKDTVSVFVLPKMNVSAGADTAIVIGQPLQLHATGGVTYQWIPGTNLSAPNIPNPIAVFDEASGGMQYKVKAFSIAGCADSAYVGIKVYGTLPQIFVPTAFTPNGDGLNDQVRPIGVGIKSIEFFNIYNRWGQLIFTTKQNGLGWDGRINGILQNNGTFVWEVKATLYSGVIYFQKGNVTLIR